MQKVCGVVWCSAATPRTADAAARAGARGRHAGARRRHAELPLPGVEQRLRRRSTRRATSGTGAATTSTRSPTRRSRCTSSSARSCRRGSRRCTSTRPTARPRAVAADATPWAYRDAKWTGVYRRRRSRSGERRRDQRLDDRLLRGAAPVLDGRLVRELHDGRGSGARAGDVRRRTTRASREIKAKYDPENVFHVNQNIKPA